MRPRAESQFDSFAPAQLALRANLRLVYLAPAPALDCQKTPPADICFLLILKILQILSPPLPCAHLIPKRKINRD
jgi:hypothetical protein